MKKHAHVLAVYNRLKSVGCKPVRSLLLREGWVQSKEEADHVIQGFFQWIAALPFSANDKPYVMFNGKVDHVFHAFVLNTEFYKEFCAEHIGFFVHHNPLDSEGVAQAELRGGIDYTLEFLQDCYGEDLHPALQEWVDLHKEGKLTIQAISCVRCEDNPKSQLTLKANKLVAV